MTGFAPWTPRPRRRSTRTIPGAYAGTSRSSTPRERPPARCSPAASTARCGSGACSSRCARMSASSSPRSAGAWTAWWPRGWCASSSARRRRRRREARAARASHRVPRVGRVPPRGFGGSEDGRRLVKEPGRRARAALTLNEELHKGSAPPRVRRFTAERAARLGRPAIDLDALRRDAVGRPRRTRVAWRSARRAGARGWSARSGGV